MAKQKKDALEVAMAEALAAVERAEKEAESPSAVDDVAIEVVEEDTEESAEEAGVQELEDRLLRLGADYDNFRKRSVRQLEEARQFGAEKVLYDLLAVIDNLERALAHAEGDQSPMVEGVRMVTKQFLDVLGMHGVTGFESMGEPFDPERHEAMGQAPSDADHSPGTVVGEMLKGYFLHDRLLRPAQVIVAAAPAEEEE